MRMGAYTGRESLVESRRMRILITNDDGADAPGLEALLEALHPRFEIAVVAPDGERSAVSHAVTFRRPIHAAKIDRPYPFFAVDGTPADCVKLAVQALLPWRPDLVLSGINRGVNVGNDVLYSGTVAGALEGAMQGLPAMAVSLDFRRAPDFAPAARFSAALLARLETAPLSPGIALNVNLPDLDPSDYRGILWTHQRGCLYSDTFTRKLTPDGRSEYFLDGEVQSAECLDPGSDGRAVLDGYVSITPLGFDLTSVPDLGTLPAAFPPLDEILGD